jgi:hypothetical protein
MKEQWKELEKDMEKRLKEKADHMNKMANKPLTIIEEEGEVSGAGANRPARWVS